MKKSFIVNYGIILFLLCNLTLKAQIKVAVIQDISVGIFYTGSTGGTVTMPSIGSRQATGSVVLFQTDPGNPAIIKIKFGGTKIITLTVGNIENLTNGSGGLMTMQIDDFYPTFPTNFNGTGGNDVYIGGTLTVGSPSTSPAGNYIGSFEITINFQ